MGFNDTWRYNEVSSKLKLVPTYLQWALSGEQNTWFKGKHLTRMISTEPRFLTCSVLSQLFQRRESVDTYTSTMWCCLYLPQSLNRLYPRKLIERILLLKPVLKALPTITVAGSVNNRHSSCGFEIISIERRASVSNYLKYLPMMIAYHYYLSK